MMDKEDTVNTRLMKLAEEWHDEIGLWLENINPQKECVWVCEVVNDGKLIGAKGPTPEAAIASLEDKLNEEQSK